MNHTCIIVFRFQLTAARRRLGDSADDCLLEVWISTHSRAKAAGGAKIYLCHCQHVSTHSRAKAAGKKRLKAHELSHISTHSRAKAAGCLIMGLPL